jgi:hypothetical protein
MEKEVDNCQRIGYVDIDIVYRLVLRNPWPPFMLGKQLA